MFLLSRLTSHKPQVLATLFLFSLSAGVLGGILFYMDSTSSNVLEEMTQDVQVDMEVECTTDFYETSMMTIDELAEIVSDQSLVVSTEVVAIIDSWDGEFPESRFRQYTYLGVDDSFFSTFSKSIHLNSKQFDLNDTSCYVEQEWANYLGLEIGGNYIAEIIAQNSNHELQRYNASYLVAGIFTTNLFSSRHASSGNPITSLRMVTTRTGLVSEFGNVGLQSRNDVFFSIWTKLDTNFIINGNPSFVESSLANIKKRIEQRTLPYAKVADFEILGIVYGYNTWAATMTVIALAFSFPSIVMGMMLLVYNSKLIDSQRRRDVGTLITRGASGWQSFNWIMSSALVTGLLGSFGAVVAGVIAAILSGGARGLMVFSEGELSSFNLSLEPTSVATIFAFSFTLGFIISLPRAINALLMSPDEAHSVVEREALTGKEAVRTPIAEIVAFVVAGLFLNPLLTSLNSGGISSTGTMLFSALFIAMFGVFFISIARIASIPTAYIKSKLLNSFRSLSLKVGGIMMSRNAILSKRSEAMGVMFIGLVFTAGFFSAVSSTTGSTHMHDLFYFNVGADIVINVDENQRYVNESIIEEIRAIEGVSDASALLKISGRVMYMQASPQREPVPVNTTITILAIDPLSWEKTAFLCPYFTLGGNPHETIRLLAENDTNVISTFMPVAQYSFGQPIYNDSVSVVIQKLNQTSILNCTVVDVMSTSYTSRSVNYFPGEPDIQDFVLMNISYVQSTLNTTRVNKVYIDLTKDANYMQVLEQVKSIANFTDQEVVAAQASIDDVLDSRTGQSIYGVYTLNLLFSLIYLTAGLMIISIVKTRRLQRQFSILRALGTPNPSIMRSVLADVCVSMLIGVLIGLMLGILMSLLVLQIPLAFLGFDTQISWSRLPVFMILPLPPLSSILFLSFLSAFVTTYAATKRGLSTNLADDFRLVE